MDYPMVSVIVVNYNGLSKLGPLLDECLKSVLSTSYDNFELIFVDNASSDGSVSHVKSSFGNEVKTLKLEKNYGYAGGANRGIAASKGDVIAVLNTDVVVKREWLKHLLSALSRDEGARIAVPKILMLEDPSKILSCGGETNVLLVAWDRYLLEYDHEQRQMPLYCFHPAGAAFVVRRELISELGGSLFDDDYFAYFEDVDLGWRTWMLGYKVIFVPQSIVYHKFGGSFGVVSNLKFYLMGRNALRTGIKNFESHIVIALLPIWILSYIYASYLFFKATHNGSYVKMGLKIVVDTIRNMKRLWEGHVIVDSCRRVPTKKLLFSNLLLTYKPSGFDYALTKLINRILWSIGIPELGVYTLKEYPTFRLLHEAIFSE